MSITNWIASVTVAVALAMGAALWFSVQRLGAVKAERDQAQEQLRSAQAAAKKVAAVSVLREKTRAATGARAASAGASLAAAVASAPDWANTPVPKEVQDALAP